MNCPGCGAGAEFGQRFCRQCGTPLDAAGTSEAASAQRSDAPASSPSGEPRPTTSNAGIDVVGRACPYCRFPLKEGVQVVTCESCSSVHHSECWEENGGCAVTGCAAGPQPQTQVLQPPPPRPTAPPPPGPPAPETSPPPFYPTPPAPGGGAGISAALAVALAAVVVVLGAGVAIALTSGGGSPTASVAPPVTTDPVVPTESQPTESTPEEATQPSETEPSTTEQTSTAAPPPPPPSTPGPVEAIETYWHDIAAHDFPAAFQIEEPFAVAHGFTESHWVEVEENEGVKGVVHHFSLGEENGETATVDVDQLRTRASRTGCFTWTGGYGMTRKEGEWLITSDNLERHSC